MSETSNLDDSTFNDTASDLFDKRVQLLSTTLDAVESRTQLLARKLAFSEDEVFSYSVRLSKAEELVEDLQGEQARYEEMERKHLQEIKRLEAALHAYKMQSAISEHRLQQSLVSEQLLTERLRVSRDDALLQRDEAIAELGTALADIDALQATLADSAVYVKYLRKKLIQLEALNQRNNELSWGRDESGVFSLASIKSAIDKAVGEACLHSPEEKKKLIRQLQLRWHPDKNPVLTEFATEVSKLINEALTKHEKNDITTVRDRN